MHKWENRENKLEKKRKKSFPLFKETAQKDKYKKKEIKQARRDKEAITDSLWDNTETEGDE